MNIGKPTPKRFGIGDLVVVTGKRSKHFGTTARIEDFNYYPSSASKGYSDYSITVTLLDGPWSGETRKFNYGDVQTVRSRSITREDVLTRNQERSRDKRIKSVARELVRSGDPITKKGYRILSSPQSVGKATKYLMRKYPEFNQETARVLVYRLPHLTDKEISRSISSKVSKDKLPGANPKLDEWLESRNFSELIKGRSTVPESVKKHLSDRESGSFDSLVKDFKKEFPYIPEEEIKGSLRSYFPMQFR